MMYNYLLMELLHNEVRRKAMKQGNKVKAQKSASNK